jgi:hypothetical protein
MSAHRGCVAPEVELTFESCMVCDDTSICDSASTSVLVPV